MAQPTKDSFPEILPASAPYRARDWMIAFVAASVAAVVTATGLQFVQRFSPLLGTAAAAISGVSILAVSVVFTAIAVVCSYVYCAFLNTTTVFLKTS